MQTDQFLSAPENRAAARAVSLQAAATLAPLEARASKRLVEPLLDMVAKGESLTAAASDASMGLGGADLALFAAVAAVVQVLVQFLAQVCESNVNAAKARVKSIQVVPAPKCREPEWIDRAKLRQTLVAHFSESELRDLCFDLRVDYESLPGEGKSDKARELVACCERHGCIFELSEVVKKLRPHVSLSDASQASEAAHQSQRVPSEGSLVVYITGQDIQGLVGDTRFAKSEKKLRELASVINIALLDYFAN